jgi:glucose-6-phosphate dehydrogenase assembly protein OpcA
VTALALDETTTRWQARATSIGETVQQLARIWSGAGREAEAATRDERMRDLARSDPRLGEWMDRGTEVRIRMRTSVLTLVVVATRPETAEHAMAVVNALASRHPSRAIVLSPGDPDGPTTYDAHIYAACRLASSSGAEVCTEEILVRTGGELSAHLSTVVAPLLIHDLPVVLWWPDDPPFGRRLFDELADTADRLLVDSGVFRGDGVRGLRGMHRVIADGHVVHDIGWMRMSLWRELLAGLFDHPLLTPELAGCRRLRLDVARPASVLRLSRAACFAAWVAAALGWRVASPLRVDRDGETATGEFRAGRRVVPVEVRAARATGAGALGPGSLVRVELEIARGRNTTRARVTRQSDHLLAVADWNGAQVVRRAGQLEPFEEMPYLAEALDRTSHDQVFERALALAVELTAA